MDFPICFAAWTKDDNLRFESTSGGLFSEFALSVLKYGGYVCGARYNDNNDVEHCIIQRDKDLREIRQSKYVQSSMNDVYSNVKKILEDNNRVLFCGTPCQVAGLKSYLNEDYASLFTIDFICKGVNSPKAYRSWINEIEKNEKKNAVNVWFKYKEGGWKTSPLRTKITFEDGTFKIFDQSKNLFMRGYLEQNLYTRESCGLCRFKGIPRQGDITLADFWGVDRKYDTDQGTSMVMINNARGMQLWNRISERIICYQADTDNIINGNPMLTESTAINPKANEFLTSLTDDNFSVSIRKCLKKKDGIIQKIKRHLGTSGHYDRIKCDPVIRNPEYNHNIDQGKKYKKKVPHLYSYKDDCMGCTACYAACPVNAIAMLEDEEGFVYPSIDAKECIRCNKCINVCPIKREDEYACAN